MGESQFAAGSPARLQPAASSQRGEMTTDKEGRKKGKKEGRKEGTGAVRCVAVCRGAVCHGVIIWMVGRGSGWAMSRRSFPAARSQPGNQASERGGREMEMQHFM